MSMERNKMSKEDVSIVPNLDDEANPTAASFDARTQYYRLWMWYVAEAGKSAIMADHERWVRCVRQLYVHAYAFLNVKERDNIEKSLLVAEMALVDMNSNNRNDPVYRQLASNNRGELERKLYDAQALIYQGMKGHNMLLPQSSNDDQGLDFNKILKEGDM